MSQSNTSKNNLDTKSQAVRTTGALSTRTQQTNTSQQQLNTQTQQTQTQPPQPQQTQPQQPNTSISQQTQPQPQQPQSQQPNTPQQPQQTQAQPPPQPQKTQAQRQPQPQPQPQPQKQTQRPQPPQPQPQQQPQKQSNKIRRQNIPPLPPPVIPIKTDNTNEKPVKITKKKSKTKSKSKSKPKKEISYDEIKIIYKDENVFGKTFSKKAKHLKCAIDFLTLHQYLNRRGKIKENEYKFIKKRYLWQYIYYLRINNKNVDMFKKYLGLGHKIKAIQLYKMIKEETKKKGDKSGNKIKNKHVDKSELKTFINKLFRKNLDLNVPFMEYYVMTNKKKISRPRKNKVDVNTKKQTTNKSQIIPTKLEIEVVTDRGKVKNDFRDSNVGIQVNAKIQKKS